MTVNLLNSVINSLKNNFKRLTALPLKSTNSGQIQSVAAMEPCNIKLSNKNQTRFKKRQWEDARKENGESEEKRLCEKTERIKRKKVAMLLGYCGVDYFGMQRNPGVRTIEEDLLKALLEAKYITEDDFNNQQNALFQRSSRTDKGVSAARQVVSLKMAIDHNVEEINSKLPSCIKVFGIKRVTNKFNSKIKCNARTYSYTLPTYVFDVAAVTEEDRKSYRISENKLEEINNVLAVYKGAKSYHNFTEKKYHNDPSAIRFMMSFGVDKVFVEKDMEFAVLLVKGQSFMLHQIRKMVGLMIAVMRGLADRSMLDKVFGKDKVIIPTAPGLGLVLDMVHYDQYDNKFKQSHGSLSWDEVQESVDTFKHEYIYPVIVNGEINSNSMGEWLVAKLERHTYDPTLLETKPGDITQEDLQDSHKITDESRNVEESGKMAEENQSLPESNKMTDIKHNIKESSKITEEIQSLEEECKITDGSINVKDFSEMTEKTEHIKELSKAT